MIKRSFYLPVVVMLLVILVSVMGCGSKKIEDQISSAVNENLDKVKKAADALIGEKDASDALGDLTDVIDKDTLNQAITTGGITKEGWPAESIPREVPEYKKGKVINSGGTEKEYTILVESTNEEDLGEYLNELAAQGWYADYDVASIKNIKLSFQFNATNLLQISVRVEEMGSWPKDKLPPDILPMDKGILLGEVYIDQLADMGFEAYYITFEYSDVTEKELKEYMKKYTDNGWDGDEYFVSKTIQWKGKAFDATLEPMSYDGNIYFSVNMGEVQ